MNKESLKGKLSFSKEERLTNKKTISELFISGQKISVHPFDFRFIKFNDESINKVLISVSKSKVNSSVKRNLLKRRIRESYRLNKKLVNSNGLCLAFIYSSSNILSFENIKKSVINLLNSLNKKYGQ